MQLKEKTSKEDKKKLKGDFIMKKLLSIILTGIMVLSLVACGADKKETSSTSAETKESSNLIGSWTGMYGIDGSYEMSEPAQLTLTFAEDGKGNLKYFSSTTDFTWVEEDGKVVCTYLDEEFIDTYGLETFEATVDGDVLRDGYLYGFDFIVAKDGTAAADPSLYPDK